MNTRRSLLKILPAFLTFSNFYSLKAKNPSSIGKVIFEKRPNSTRFLNSLGALNNLSFTEDGIDEYYSIISYYKEGEFGNWEFASHKIDGFDVDNFKEFVYQKAFKEGKTVTTNSLIRDREGISLDSLSFYRIHRETGLSIATIESGKWRTDPQSRKLVLSCFV